MGDPPECEQAPMSKGLPSPLAMSQPERASIARARVVLGSGTGHMIVGTLVAALAAYLFQLIVGRSLGPTVFAPITVLWTIQFLCRHALLHGRILPSPASR